MNAKNSKNINGKNPGNKNEALMEEDARDETDGQQKGHSNKILLLAGLLAGLMFGGGGAYFFFSMGVKNAEIKNAAQIDADKKKDEEEKAKQAPAPQFIDVRTLPASLADADGRVLGYVFFDLKLEVSNESDYRYVFDRLPLIVDALIKDIPEHPVSRAGRPGDIDYERVSARFAVVANEALGGSDRVKAVQIANVVRQ